MILPQNFDPKERGERARKNFLSGYNCCQSVLLAFSDILEENKLAEEKILKVIGSGFGGGFAKMRKVCGSFSGCTMMAGFIRPADTVQMEKRKANYALVQEMAEEFKKRNKGSIICGELLGISGYNPETPEPSERTEEYYRKRPCPEIIRNAATIVGEKMLQEANCT